MPRQAFDMAMGDGTATGSSQPHNNNDSVGGVFYLNLTAVSGTNPTLDLKIQGQIPGTSTWIDITDAAFAQKTTTGADSLTIYPGVTVVANRSVANIVPSTFRGTWTIGGTDTPTFTGSLTVSLIGAS